MDKKEKGDAMAITVNLYYKGVNGSARQKWKNLV